MIKINEITKNVNIKKVTPPHCPSFSGIVAGECKGDVWIDASESPNVAIANSYAVGGFAFLGGIPSSKEYSEIRSFIYGELFDLLKEQGTDYFEFSIENENAKEQVLSMFSSKEIQSEQELHYIKKERDDRSHPLPEQYSLHEVNSELWDAIEMGQLENKELVTERILESWHSIEDFFEKSLAFCIIHAGKIVAVIVGTASFNKVVAIDIETEEAHRKKGLGLILTQAFVNECIARGITPQWSCVESNAASRKLVERAGFEFLKQNDVYWFSI